MTQLEILKLYDEILLYIINSHSGSVPIYDLQNIPLNRLNRGMDFKEGQKFKKAYLQCIRDLESKNLIVKYGERYSVSTEGREKQRIGFVNEYEEIQKDKNLERRSYETSIKLTEQQLLDIKKSKLRSRVAIIISLGVLLFEVFKFVYQENKHLEKKDENRKTQSPPR